MKYVAVLFTVFIIAIIILADRGQLGPLHFIYDIPYGDKVGHFVLFGLLNLFQTSAFLKALPDRRPKLVAIRVGLILALLVGAEEFSQKYFATRTFDLLDLSASYLGLIVGGWTALRLKQKVTPQA